MLRIGTSAFVALLLTASANVVGAQSLDEAASGSLTDASHAATALKRAGGVYGGVLAMERLPSADYLVEIAVVFEAGVIRYPLKMKRADGWKVVWEPGTDYAKAVGALVSSGKLPEVGSTAKWSEVQRIPSLPVVVTRARFVTPFGPVPVGDRAPDAPEGALQWSPMLVEHGRKWVNEVLDSDPAPAGIDLVVAADVTWQTFNKLVMNLSASGLYQISAVVLDEGLGLVQVSAPVTKLTEKTPAVALYPDGARGWGVRTGGGSGTAEPCSPEFDICVEEPAELPTQLERRIDSAWERATFAAVGAVAVGDALGFAAATIDYFGLGPHRLIVGFVDR